MSDFWDYSVATYRRPGVAEACLDLQDRGGADVNLLLFCCWLAQRGEGLTDELLNDAVSLSQPWREAVVAPLRRVRRWMKSSEADLDQAALREAIKACELEAERYQQDRLDALAGAASLPTTESADVKELARRYLFRLRNQRLHHAEAEAVEALLDAVFAP